MGDGEGGRILILSLEKAKESIFPYIYRAPDANFVFGFPSNRFDYIQKTFFEHLVYPQGLMLRILAFSFRAINHKFRCIEFFFFFCIDIFGDLFV